jgi:hypothetical protein
MKNMTLAERTIAKDQADRAALLLPKEASTKTIAAELAARRADVMLGLTGDANRVVREANHLIGYLQELVARVPASMKQFDIDDPVHYNAILRIVEAVEGSHRDMRRVWDEPHTERRAQLILIDTIADKIKDAAPKAEGGLND